MTLISTVSSKLMMRTIWIQEEEVGQLTSNKITTLIWMLKMKKKLMKKSTWLCKPNNKEWVMMKIKMIFKTIKGNKNNFNNI